MAKYSTDCERTFVNPLLCYIPHSLEHVENDILNICISVSRVRVASATLSGSDESCERRCVRLSRYLFIPQLDWWLTVYSNRT